MNKYTEEQVDFLFDEIEKILNDSIYEQDFENIMSVEIDELMDTISSELKELKRDKDFIIRRRLG